MERRREEMQRNFFNDSFFQWFIYIIF
jgi:hypothetical protein